MTAPRSNPWRGRRKGGLLRCARNDGKIYLRDSRRMLLRPPLPPRSGGEGSGVGGGAASSRSSGSCGYDPPPPTPPHHAQGRVEGGERTHLRDLAACYLREFCLILSLAPEKGAGNAGRSMRPTASCARWSRKSTRVSTGHTGNTRHSPRNGFTAYFVLSPVIGLVCHRRCRNCSANLTPASRRQDHTTSPSASSALVRSTVSVHRIPPRVHDVAQRPFGGTGRRAYTTDLGRSASTIFEIRKIISETPSPLSCRADPAIHPLRKNGFLRRLMDARVTRLR